MNLPHISTYKRRWVRRVMLLAVHLPVELVRQPLYAAISVILSTAMWWQLP